MSRLRIALSAAMLAAAVVTASGVQAASVDDVKHWSYKQWLHAKSEWSKDKVKWASCRKDAKAQGLKGRKNWSFLYTCMKG